MARINQLVEAWSVLPNQYGIYSATVSVDLGLGQAEETKEVPI